MQNGSSKLLPQHINWDHDLHERGELDQSAKLDLDGTLNEISPTFLDLGRSHMTNRGAMTIICSAFAIGWLALLFLFWEDGLYVSERQWIGGNQTGPMVVMLRRDFVDTAALTAIGSIFGGLICFFGFRFDIAPPRDMPIRFNRRMGKVYFNSYKMNFNPFSKWGPETKVWDWSTVHAEVARISGFTGKVYQVRYVLILSTCKPGTLEVVDRETVAGPSMTDMEFESMWAYICKYMAEGKDAVPEQPVRDRGVYFWRSFFEYAEWIAPTRWGHEARRRSPRGEKIFIVIMSPLLLALLPISLPLGIGHFIAMSLAKAQAWPASIDAESRT